MHIVAHVCCVPKNMCMCMHCACVPMTVYMHVNVCCVYIDVHVLVCARVYMRPVVGQG